VKPLYVAAFFALALPSSAQPATPALAVVDYDARLKLDIAETSVTGEVTVTAVAGAAGGDALVLDCGELTVDSASRDGRALPFSTADHRVTVPLSARLRAGQRVRVTLRYHGQPRRGLRFAKDRRQAYTVFSTSQWLPSADAPDPKAGLRLALTVPEGLHAVGSGNLVSRRAEPGGSVTFRWTQAPLSTYVFGFAVGPFRVASETHRGVRLDYLSASHSDEELRRIFVETKGMLEFFEDRAGVRFPGKTYSQVLVAVNAEQEVGMFTLLGESYGTKLLEDPTDLWLMAHEFAHQWWGNGVTCRDWNHFWLNEGMATFLADAYKEKRLGREAYLKEIESSRTRYEKVRDEGQDRALVFPNWSKPTANDRTIVYQKGAYVLHLLREHLGETRFWAGLRAYTREYMGRSVTTPDFQKAMEKATGADLADFFQRWVYGASAGGA